MLNGYFVTRTHKNSSPHEKNSEGNDSYLYARVEEHGHEKEFGDFFSLLEVRRIQVCVYTRFPSEMEWVTLEYPEPVPSGLVGSYCTFEVEDVIAWVNVQEGSK